MASLLPSAGGYANDDDVNATPILVLDPPPSTGHLSVLADWFTQGCDNMLLRVSLWCWSKVMAELARFKDAPSDFSVEQKKKRKEREKVRKSMPIEGNGYFIASCVIPVFNIHLVVQLGYKILINGIVAVMQNLTSCLHDF